MTETIGERLKQARQDRSLSLESVARATHIKVQFLELLENNQYDQLPSRVQSRGFLRLYADFLGIPFQPLLDLLDGKNTVTNPSHESGSGIKPDLITSDDIRSAQYDITALKTVDTGEDDTQSSSTDSGNQTSPKIFTQIGKELQTRRESLGISIDDAEKYTFLRQHYLKALESGEFEKLPSLVHVRGMLSNYATFLELDTDGLLLQFAEGLQARRLEMKPTGGKPGLFKRPKKSKKSGWKQLITPDLLIGSSFIILLFLFVLWGASQIISNQSTLDIPVNNPIGNAFLVSSTPIGVPTELLTNQATSGFANSQQNPGTPQPNTTLESTATLPVLGDAPLQLYIIANQRAFLRVTVDNQIKFNGRVIPGGAPYTFAGTTKIELLTGNAAAIQVYFNQNEIGVLGQLGEVKSLIFSKDGVFTPTPSFSPTPTVTLPATVTAQATPSITPTVVTPTLQ